MTQEKIDSEILCPVQKQHCALATEQQMLYFFDFFSIPSLGFERFRFNLSNIAFIEIKRNFAMYKSMMECECVSIEQSFCVSSNIRNFVCHVNGCRIESNKKHREKFVE